VNHDHLWDEEPEADVTYTPPDHYDRPWIIRMCCEGGCDAIKVTHRVYGYPRTLVYENPTVVEEEV
jgi:hypothetical protein